MFRRAKIKKLLKERNWPIYFSSSSYIEIAFVETRKGHDVVYDVTAWWSQIKPQGDGG